MNIEELIRVIPQLESDSAALKLASVIRTEVGYRVNAAVAGINRGLPRPRPEEIEMARDGRKFKAVKSYKERHGTGLIETKTHIESFM